MAEFFIRKVDNNTTSLYKRQSGDIEMVLPDGSLVENLSSTYKHCVIKVPGLAVNLQYTQYLKVKNVSGERRFRVNFNSLTQQQQDDLLVNNIPITLSAGQLTAVVVDNQ